MKPEAVKQEPGGRRAGCWRPLAVMGLSVLLTAVVLEILLRLYGSGQKSQFNAALASADRSPYYYLNFAYGAKKLVEKPSGNPDRID